MKLFSVLRNIAWWRAGKKGGRTVINVNIPGHLFDWSTTNTKLVPFHEYAEDVPSVCCLLLNLSRRQRRCP
jgi:hypothetical protein